MDTPGINTVSLHGKVYELVATFSTKMMSTLWERRGKMGKAQAAILKGLYDSKKGRYCTESIMGTPVIYRLSISNEMGRLGYGRYYSTPSGFECLEGIIRGTLLHKTHTNVDIKNCHSTIIYQYARNILGITMPHLEYYATHTDEVRTKLMKDCGLTKQQVKDLFTITLYNGYTKIHCHQPITIEEGMVSHQIISDIKREIVAFTALLKTEERHSALLSAVRRLKEKNVDGSFVSYVIQREERLILDVLIKQLQRDNIKVDSLDYDGYTARGILDPIYLRNGENEVRNELNYSITLEIKDFEFIPDSELVDKKEDPEYLRMKGEFEREHAYYRPGNAIVEMGKYGLQTFTLEHANEAFNHLLIDDEKNPLFITRWRKDPKRRIVERLVMKENPDEDELSIFRGLHYKTIGCEIDTTTRQKYEEHFKDLLSCACGDDKIASDYVLGWFANMIQNPLSTTVGTCLLFYSRTQGTGKDTLLKIMMSIIGKTHSAHHPNSGSFWEKHTVLSSTAIFEYVEDAGADYLTEANIGEFRGRITSTLRSYNPKNKTPYQVDNKTHHCASTNVPFKLEDSDRRIFPLNASTRLVTQDWERVYNLIEQPEYIQTIGEYLENYSLGGWTARPLPETAYRTDVKEASYSSEQLFLGSLEKNVEYSLEELFRSYRLFCLNRELPYCHSALSLGRKLVPYYGVCLRKVRDGSGFKYSTV